MAKSYRKAKWEDHFLELYARIGSVTVAARGAGIVRTTVYERRRRYPEFARRMDAAREDAIENLIAIAFQRAISGSDRMLTFLLQSLAPERFGHSDADHGRLTIVVEHVTTPYSTTSYTVPAPSRNHQPSSAVQGGGDGAAVREDDAGNFVGG